jgi:membrane protein YqaA with SNARE-associated domain
MDWALFLSALLSSTLLPGSSEAVLVIKLQGGGDPAVLVASATLGNLLGSIVTYLMGPCWVDASLTCGACQARFVPAVKK